MSLIKKVIAPVVLATAMAVNSGCYELMSELEGKTLARDPNNVGPNEYTPQTGGDETGLLALMGGLYQGAAPYQTNPQTAASFDAFGKAASNYANAKANAGRTNVTVNVGPGQSYPNQRSGRLPPTILANYAVDIKTFEEGVSCGFDYNRNGIMEANETLARARNLFSVNEQIIVGVTMLNGQGVNMRTIVKNGEGAEVFSRTDTFPTNTAYAYFQFNSRTLAPGKYYALHYLGTDDRASALTEFSVHP